VRFLCGIDLGDAVPNVMALVSKYALARKRNTLVALTWCGFALGAVLGGLISVPLIANFGWAAVFVGSGVLPLCTVPLISLFCRNRSSSDPYAGQWRGGSPGSRCC
jgi:AAHS family 4-hydroxybenzoate transporter-like MFS transporter